MESHPLTKFVVGFLGLAIVVIAVWIGRAGGDRPTDNPQPSDQASEDVPPEPEKDADKRPPIAPAPGPYPELVAEETTHNFSVMAVGTDGTHKFQIRNEGEAPLVLVKGPSTCKCTISDLTDNQVPPGESTVIDLTWKARAVSDQFRQTATIYTNDPEMRELELSISGRITKTVEVSPQGAWVVDDLTSNAGSSVTGTIYSYVLDAFELEAPEVSSDQLEVEYEPLSAARLETTRAKSGYLVKVNLTSGIAVGLFREKITIRVKDQKMDPLSIFVEGKRTGPISFLSARGTSWNPSSMVIDLGEFPAEQGARGALLLFVGGLDDQELKILSVESDPEELEVTLTADPNFEGTGRKKYELAFQVPSGARRATRTARRMARVVVHTNHPEASELKFRLNYISR